MHGSAGREDSEVGSPAGTWGISLRQAVIWTVAGIAIVVAIWLLEGGNPSESLASGSGVFDGLAAIGGGPRVGQAAPDFVLNDTEGRPVRLSELRGKTVFVNFWASWCPPCRAEMPDIEQIYQEFKDKDVVVLAINQREDPETIRRFMQSLNLTFPVLLDRNGAVAQQYRISAIPTSFFIDRGGIIRAVNVGSMSRLGIMAKLEMAR